MEEYDPMNPQARLMADESMLRTLKHQAEAIWPEERALFERYRLRDGARILDVGCGTGEIALRLAELLPTASIVGIDLIEAHLELARKAGERFGGRVRFETGNAFDLAFPDDGFDLALCRHVLQAVPEPERIAAEMLRVTRPGGRLHLLVEDYGMIFFHPTRYDAARFWIDGPRLFGEKTGTDLYVGRSAYTMLRRLGLGEITIDYLHVDTLRVARETFAQIWISWRDGYAESVSEYTGMPVAEAVARFDDMIATLRDPDGYGLWLIPIAAGVKSGAR